ncbi:MAG: DUF6817 domain-containing protein [Pseudomonadota bacterium]
MLKLAYDFTSRAIMTLRGKPIVGPAERPACSWQPSDLAGASVLHAPQNELTALREDLFATAARYKHSRGRAFTEHLEGVAKLLTAWDQPAGIVQTGLLHSAYSTQQYPYGLFDYGGREELARLVGDDAERLVFLFCSHDRVDLYAQALDLAREGRALPDAGLVLRNALTGEHGQVPKSMLAPLLMVHAADLVEQMNGFDYRVIYALLDVLRDDLELPACHALMREAGVGEQLDVKIDPRRGTFGLLPVVGLAPELFGLRLRILRWLRGSEPLPQVDLYRIQAARERAPFLLELPWLQLTRDASLESSARDALQAEVRRLASAWGVPWIKGPFENNARFAACIAA